VLQVCGSRKVRWHRQIGSCLENADKTQPGTIALTLALHFKPGRDAERAVYYFHQAGVVALQRCAYPEAVSLLSTGLDLARTLPDDPVHHQRQLHLQLALGGARMATDGFSTEQVAELYVNAQTFRQQETTQERE
jgi:hypothetical protein